jgi:DNA helicase II / ATP-dependent DNA helicase PcrA
MTHEEMVEWFACNVCGKPAGVRPDECHSTFGRQNQLCSDYECCRINEKSKQQLKYAKSGIDKNIFLTACPGSGKTEVVGLKAAYEIKQWNRNKGGIAVLTFTNNAANVIHERVCQFAGVHKAGYPHFIGTLSRWLQRYIANPFACILTDYKGLNGDRSIRLVENSSDSDFLKGFQTIAYPSSGPIKANEYSWDCEQKKYVFGSRSRTVDAARNNIPFTSEQTQELKEKKKSFLMHGFATHQDVEFICFRLLEKHAILTQRISERFPVIIVDECQDLSWTEMAILKHLQDFAASLHFIGDLKQAIYDFKNVAPEKVETFVRDNQFDVMTLNENYRSGQVIVDVCQAIVKDENKLKGMREAQLDAPCLFLTYKKDDIQFLPHRFEEYLKEKGLDVNKSAIVARGWSTVSKLRPSGNSNVKNDQLRLAAAISLSKTGGIQAVGDTLRYMGQFVAYKFFPKYSVNAREYYCPECVTSAIRWRLFLARLLDLSLKNNNIADLNQTWPNWAKNVRTHLHNIAEESRAMLADYVLEDLGPFKAIKFNALSRNSSTIIDSLPQSPQQKTDILITTIHAMKGKTLDAIMLVSAPSKQGTIDGHWEQWLDDPCSEAARFAYVGSSRPKYLLLWAIPENKNKDYSELEKLGFIPHVISTAPH